MISKLPRSRSIYKKIRVTTASADTMKSSIRFFLILTLLTFFSCSKSSDKPADPNPTLSRILKFTLKGKVFDASVGASSGMGGGFYYTYFNTDRGYLDMQGYSKLLSKEEGDNTIYDVRIWAAILNKDLKNQTFKYAPNDLKPFSVYEIETYFKKGVQEVWEYDSQSNGELYIENFEFKQGGNIKGTMKVGVKGSSLTNKDEKQQVVISFSGTYE